MATRPSETDAKLRKQRLIFYEDDIERINRALENYQNLSKSRCNMLIDVEGHPVTQVGSTEGINLETIAALVAASMEEESLTLVPLALVYRFSFALLLDVVGAFATLEELLDVEVRSAPLERLHST